MDKEHFELLLRQSPFCRAMLSDVWEALNSGQQIDLLLHLSRQSTGIPRNLQLRATQDANPVIRMLAVRCSYVSAEHTPGLYSRLINDPSPLVRAEIKRHDRHFIDARDFASLSQEERLGVVALSDSLYERALAEFVTEGLVKKILTEHEAVELVVEFMRNPSFVRNLERDPGDGLDRGTMRENFEAIWNLTTSTPPRVHKVIAWEYPLRTARGVLPHTIPDEMLERMSTEALQALAFRGYEPLLDRINKTPDKFDQKVRDAAHNGAELRCLKTNDDQSEIALLREELDKLRTEIRGDIDALAQQISESISRRRGIFG